MLFGLIIAGWGVYFVPRWVRNYEERSEARSVEKFTEAMRILSHKAEEPTDAEPAGERRPPAGPAPEMRRAPRRVTPLAMRRRRILAGLLLVTVVVAVLTPFTPVPWQAPVGLVLVLAGFLVHLRVQARRASDLTRSRQSIRRRAGLRLRRFDALDRILASRQRLAEERAAALAARLEAEAAAEQSAREEEERLAAAADGWQPVPVPLPTYVTKPRAPERAVRSPAADASVDQSVTAAAPVAAPVAVDEPDELDEIIERRRAVND